jgi:hypothetical protein
MICALCAPVPFHNSARNVREFLDLVGTLVRHAKQITGVAMSKCQSSNRSDGLTLRSHHFTLFSSDLLT